MKVDTVSTQHPTSDVEYLRKKAEFLHGRNYGLKEFYEHNNILYTVSYVDEVPRWICLFQQRREWEKLNVFGIIRRSYTDYIPKTGIDTETLGLFGEPSVLQQVEHAKKNGMDKLFISNVRKSFIRSSLSKIHRMKALTGQDWFCDYNLYQILPYTDPSCSQYCLWNHQKECFFEKKA